MKRLKGLVPFATILLSWFLGFYAGWSNGYERGLEQRLLLDLYGLKH